VPGGVPAPDNPHHYPASPDRQGRRRLVDQRSGGRKGNFGPPGGVLRSGDRFHIAFDTSKSAQVYVLFQDSAGKITPLFSGKVQGNKLHKLPGEHDWFKLDENTGQEKVHVLASKSPIANLHEVVELLTREGTKSLEKAYPQIYCRSFSFQRE